MSGAGARQNRKAIKIIESNGFRKPYQILVDSAFVEAMNKLQEPAAQIQHALRDFAKLFIPKCEYEKHKKNMRPKDASGQCEILKCTHGDGDSCLDAYIREGNKHHYVLASMDPETIKKFRGAPRVPLMRIKNSRVVIEIGEMQRASRESRGVAATRKELRRLARLFGGSEEEDATAK